MKSHKSRRYFNYSQSQLEQLEYSTQIMIAAALRRNWKVRLLSGEENCIEIENAMMEKQIIIQASNTTLDHYVTILLMQSKTLTKTMFKQAQIPYPVGNHYTNVDAACEQVKHFYENKQGIVIKPDTTNYGLGVMMLTEIPQNQSPLSYSNFMERYDVKKHIQHCLKLSSQVIVEQYHLGCEFRFLVIDNQCVAVCYREPANIIGDGFSNISALIQKKNLDPRRGTRHRKPLQIIQCDTVMKSYLQQQNLTLDHVPKSGQKIYLRGNSNISSGGEAINMTKQMPLHYKSLALKAAQAVGSRCCGVDIIIEGSDMPELNHSPKPTIVLEVNHNPCLFIHEVPYSGLGEPVCDHILNALFSKS